MDDWRAAFAYREQRSTWLGFPMVLGMSLSTFTVIHVVISLIAIASGVVTVAGMVASHRLPTWTAIFLVTTVLTSVTGFLFPFTEVKPSHIFGVISLVVLALAVAGLYVFDLRGRWRATYVITSMVALYLNAFVLVVQAFQKVPALNPLAPTGSEPPFAVAQVLLLAICVWAGYQATRGFQPHRPTVGVAAAL